MVALRRLYGAALAFFALVVVLGVLLPRGRPRSWQTAGFTGMAAASVLYAVAALPFALLRGARFLVPRRGAIDVEPDEERTVEAFDAEAQMEYLAPSRQAAFDALLDQPPLACAACGTRWVPPVLGRVGKRILRRSEDPFDVLGEGWWSRATPPPPCPGCGANEIAPRR